MICPSCCSESDDLSAVPGSSGLLCSDCRKKVASEHGRTSMSRRTPEQKMKFVESGGNALLRQQGLQYYTALARRSVAARLRKRLQEQQC